MKEYRFDYIRENVEKWNPSIPRTVEQMEHLPWDVLFPWIGLDENCQITATLPRDHYGEEIEDFAAWHAQRDKYIRNLAKEYENLQNERG